MFNPIKQKSKKKILPIKTIEYKDNANKRYVMKELICKIRVSFTKNIFN